MRIERRDGRWRVRLGPVAVPVGVSLVVHAAMAAVLATVAWRVGVAPGGRGGEREVVITFDQPATTTRAAPDTPPPPPGAATSTPGAGVGSTPGAPAELPRLDGLSGRQAAAPDLRSLGSGVGAGESLVMPTRREGPTAGATFAGAKAERAASVVYVVDASGAMVSSMKFVLDELERSVKRLAPEQKFQIVLFREPLPGETGRPYEIFRGSSGRHSGLVPATALNKAAAAEWIRTVRPSGRSDPEAGLVRALELRPDVIFLLSRSIRRSNGEGAGVWGRGREGILAELERLNPRDGTTGQRPVVIKTIQFVEEDPTGTMQAIGARHGDGPDSYRVLTLAELGAE